LLRHSSMSGEELIQACAEGNDGAAWDEFVRRFHRPISLSIIRTAYQWGEIPQQVVDDLVQETYLKLCTNKCCQLLEFARRHPGAILGYVKTIAVNVAHDYFKSLHSQKRGSGQINQIMEDTNPTAAPSELGGPEAMERGVLFKQIDECIETCLEGPDQDRDRTIFWLYYQQGMTAKDIAALPTIGLSAKGVESVLVRVIRLVRERMVGMQIQMGSKPTQGEKGFLPAESY
jgi:RNA polymerase sigma-70 factor, ECF subfamily